MIVYTKEDMSVGMDVYTKGASYALHPVGDHIEIGVLAGGSNCLERGQIFSAFKLELDIGAPMVAYSNEGTITTNEVTHIV